jgi:hypothetical protein
MNWWQWLIAVAVVIFVSWGIVFWLLESRAGAHRQQYADGCPKPIIEKAVRADGSRKNIIPRRGDGEIDDLEHLLDHEEERHDR